MDEQAATVILTIHNASEVKKDSDGNNILKIEVIYEHARYIVGEDVNEQLLDSCNLLRRSIKW